MNKCWREYSNNILTRKKKDKENCNANKIYNIYHKNIKYTSQD